MHRALTTRSTGPLAGGAYAPSARGRLAWFVRHRDVRLVQRHPQSSLCDGCCGHPAGPHVCVGGGPYRLAGASLAAHFHLQRFRAVGRAGQLLVGAVGGLIFGLVAAGIGALAAEFSLWALLLWFLL